MAANDSRLAPVIWAPFVLGMAAAVGCNGAGDGDSNAPGTGFSSTGGTGAETDPDVVETESVDTEAPPITTGVDSSGTVDSSADTTGPPAGVCGDGEVEGDEACDDGNAVDGDGCNEGCIASGSPVWTWSTEDQMIADMAVAANGSIFVAVQSLDGVGGNIVELSSEGMEVGNRELPVPKAPSGGTLDFRVSTIDTIDNQPVYTSEALYLDGDGRVETVRQTVQLFGPGGWMLEGEGVLRQGISADATGRLVGYHGDDVVEYDEAGNTEWTTQVFGTDGVRARSAGGTFGFDRGRVWALDAAGDPLWGIDTSDEEMTRFLAIAQSAEGGVIAAQEVVDDDATLGRLWSIDADGEVTSMADFDSRAMALAVDGEGNIFLPIEDEATLAKLTADNEEIWTYPLGGPPIIDVEVHPEGVAVVALRDNSVSKLAF